MMQDLGYYFIMYYLYAVILWALLVFIFVGLIEACHSGNVDKVSPWMLLLL